ncbi:hypothetical protein B7463_g556, partial [Scytalidium lignicola]
MRSFCALSLAGVASAQVTAWGQCGGNGWTGGSSCVSGYWCSTVNAYYAQCTPGTAPATASASSTTTTAPKPVCTSSCSKVAYAGVNIAGFDFGCGNDGTCNLGGYYDIVRDDNGLAQLAHLASLGLNTFRLPVGWQTLVNGNLGGAINVTAAADYFTLVQSCLDNGAALCIIDIHNYARWNGGIIGQGGPTNDQFASIWSQLATKYKSESRIAFGIMNEPHDIPNITLWAGSVQAAVTAIRQTGATSQMILMPGSDYTSAQQFISDGSGPALLGVKNPDGGTTGLIMDVHKYLDSDNTGTSSECTTNNIDTAFAPLATWLRSNGRQAILSETGGGSTASCEMYLCQQLQYLNQNADVYLGWTGWAAGGFSTGYPLSESPTELNGVWTDTPILSQCILGAWK